MVYSKPVSLLFRPVASLESYIDNLKLVLTDPSNCFVLSSSFNLIIDSMPGSCYGFLKILFNSQASMNFNLSSDQLNLLFGME